MKQIRRAQVENERMENRDNHNTRDDNDTKNFTTEAKGSKAKADDLTTEAKGGKAKADDTTAEAKGGKARADDLTTEAKSGKARTEESRSKSEAATRDDTIQITTKTTTMINEQGESSHSQWEKRDPAQ